MRFWCDPGIGRAVQQSLNWEQLERDSVSGVASQQFPMDITMFLRTGLSVKGNKASTDYSSQGIKTFTQLQGDFH